MGKRRDDLEQTARVPEIYIIARLSFVLGELQKRESLKVELSLAG